MKSDKPAVLVVDDEIETLKMLRKILETRGWRAFTAPTAISAMAIVEKEKIDLVLLDIRLPGESGLDILREIKAKFKTLPVIIITGFGYNDELINEAVRLGASGYVSKGMPLNELFEVINNTMAK